MYLGGRPKCTKRTTYIFIVTYVFPTTTNTDQTLLQILVYTRKIQVVESKGSKTYSY